MMIRSWCVLAALAGALAAAGSANAALPPVFLYHDEAYVGFNYLTASKDVVFAPDAYWPILPGTADVRSHHRELMEALRGALVAAGVPAQILDAVAWGRLCQERKAAIIVDIGQVVPDTVFKGQQTGAPLRDWLVSGGTLVYSGDWPFFWYVDGSGKLSCEGAGPQGDDAIFGADLVKDGFTGFPNTPTEVGKRWLPSLSASWSQRPFDLAAVQKACPWSEAYLVGEREQGGAHQVAADGLAFRPPGARGYFAGFHFRPGMHTDTNQLVFEFLTRRAPALFGGERP